MPSFEDYKILLNSQKENDRYYELVILSHSQMSKTYYLVRDSLPLTVTLDGSLQEFEQSVMNKTGPINSNDLDQIASFTIADIENALDAELDNIGLDTEEDVLCRALIYISTDLVNPVEDITYFVDSVPQEKGVFTVKSSVTDLNRETTGEAATLTRFPMNRAI